MKKTIVTIIAGAALMGSLTACATDEHPMTAAVVKSTKLDADLAKKVEKLQDKEGSLAAAEELMETITSDEYADLYCDDIYSEFANYYAGFSQQPTAAKEQAAEILVPNHLNLMHAYTTDDPNERVKALRDAEPLISADGEHGRVLDVNLVLEDDTWKVCL